MNQTQEPIELNEGDGAGSPNGNEESRERPSIEAFDPHFPRLFVDGDRVSGAIREDESLWSGY
jgi:hypothetical protein